MESPIIAALRRGYAEFNESQGDAAQEGLSPDFEMIDHILPEGGPTGRGPEVLPLNFRRITEVFGEVEYEPEEFLERDGKVLVRLHATSEGARHTGIPMEMTIGHIWTFGEQGAERLEIFRSWEETLAAVSPQGAADGA